jgi:Fe-S oxidoreductase
MNNRLKVLKVMKPEVRWDRIPERINLVIKYVLAQLRLFKEPLPGLMHFFIFWGFMVLSIATISHYVSGISLGAHLLNLFGLIGENIVQHVYNWLKDITEIFVLVSVVYALFRRIITKPERLTLSGEANLILIFIFFLVITDWFVGAGEAMELQAKGIDAWWIPVGSAFVPIVQGMGGGAHLFIELNYWMHILIVLVFLNLLPLGKHFHVITAIPNVFFGDFGKDTMIKYFDCQDESVEKWGYNALTDYTWKVMFDAYTCTECGRCRDNCPAYKTGKPLDPKQINAIIKASMKANVEKLFKAFDEAKAKGEKFNPDTIEDLTPFITTEVSEDIHKQAGITHEMLWACTTCGHCYESCPVLIEHVHRLVDLRRFLAMSEAEFPQELNDVFRGFENNSNPWALGQDTRGDWAEKDVEVKTIESNPEFEYLLYLGCSYSYDERNKKISNALIKLLNKAGVNYAYLGAEECCCGETARRLGNEFLGNMMVMMNIAVLNGHNVKKIISPCPHCFNTLKNEYSQYTDLDMEGTKLQGDFEVIHTAEFIKSLIDQGKIILDKELTKKVVYHDSCYLGRYNQIFDEPRSVIGKVPGVKMVEAEMRREKGFCCGAGGGRMWMEEEVEQRVNTMRFKQLLETNPEVICTACPYCMTMLDDACKDQGKEEQVKNLDFIEVVAQAAGLIQ